MWLDATTSTKASSYLDGAKKSEGEVSSVVSSLATYDDLLSRMEECSPSDAITMIKRVQISDCGGQPQFHEILPIFIRGTTLYLFVFKLNEELSAHPVVKYYENGKPICDAYPCAETNEQILEHCLRVIRSQKASVDGEPPRIMIIGTHKDKEHECMKETREAKNEKLVNLLLPEFVDEVEFYCMEPKQVVFPLNARNPGDEEKQTAEYVRFLVSRCSASVVEIPLQWHGLEVLLEDLAKVLERGILSINECFAAAQNLHFDDEAGFDAALKYLDQLNIIFYYPDILPGVVFASAQVLLDKVTELVRAIHQVRHGAVTVKRYQQGKIWRRFCDHALVSQEFLAQECFQEHYVPDLFESKDLIVLFKKLLIFADFSDEESFVPALLRQLKEAELGKHRVSCSSSAASPLVLTFPKHGGPLLGVFCASVVALLSKDNTHPCPWKLKAEKGKVTPSCLYRNCVKFMIPDHPGSITVVDSFEYIEVHVYVSTEAMAIMDDGDLADFCEMIREGIIKAIRKATIALNYDYHEPAIGFGCLCDHPMLHVATVNASKWMICSKDSDKCYKLAANHYIWMKERQEKVPHASIDSQSLPVASMPMQQGISSSIASMPAQGTIDSTSASKPRVPLITDDYTKELKLDENSKQHPQGASESAPKLRQQDSPLTVTVHSESHVPTSGSDSMPTPDTTEPNEGASMNINPEIEQLLLSETKSGETYCTPKKNQHKPCESIERTATCIDSTSPAEASANISLHVDSTPKLHQLCYLNYNNRTIKVIERVASKWEHVATQLYFEGHLINTVKRDSHFQADAACRDMFTKWLEGMGREPVTWGTLINALYEANLSSVAKELGKIFNYTYESKKASKKKCQLQ